MLSYITGKLKEARNKMLSKSNQSLQNALNAATPSAPAPLELAPLSVRSLPSVQDIFAHPDLSTPEKIIALFLIHLAELGQRRTTCGEIARNINANPITPRRALKNPSLASLFPNLTISKAGISF